MVALGVESSLAQIIEAQIPHRPSGGNMGDKKIIAVTGATGAQAGELARAILDDPSGEFALRAITRDPGKDAARALADRGADEASLQSAFDGAYGAYCLTNFWERFSGEKETAQGGNLARAAAAASPARHLVDLRGHAQVHPARRQPDADAPGEVQGRPFRREGRRQPLLHGRRRADHFPLNHVLLGELHLLRPRPNAKR